MKKIICLILVISAMTLVFASCSKTKDINTDVIDEAEDNNYTVSGAAGEESFAYEITELNTIRIIGYTGSFDIHEITVPSEIDEIEVTDIGPKAFYFANNISKVTLPDTITTIDDYAFSGCTYLKEIVIPAGVKKIGAGAFYKCVAIESIKLPENITEISKYAFYECTALKEIALPAGVTSIGESAFWCCTALKSVTGTNALTEIGGYAFNGCKVLEKIDVPTSAVVGEYAFNECEKLK